MISRRYSLLIRGTLFTILVAAVCLISFFPVLWMGISSLKVPTELYDWPVTYIPKPPTIEHYVDVFTLHPFGRFFVNSLWVAGWSTALTVFISVLGAYPLTRLRFKGRTLVLMFILSSGMLPVLSRLIPLFSTMRALGLLNSYTGTVLIYSSLALPLSTMTMMAFFGQVPQDLESAAIIDGCTRMGALWRIMVPLAAPGMVTAALLSFIIAWNDFIIALVLISRPMMRTIPVGIALFPGEYDFPWGTISAAVIVAVVPIVVAIVFFQRRIVAGLTSGAVKF